MSDREMALSLLNRIPDYKVGYALAYLQGLVADEGEDDAFCASLYQEYLMQSEEPEFISLHEAAEQSGIQL